MRLVALLAVAACTPTTSTIASSDRDPDRDEGPHHDAAIDAASVDAQPDAMDTCPDPIVDLTDPDMDHDGIANAADNCPRIYNPTQTNEDGDTLGDACDKCPPYPDDTQPNMDGDCVSDACDPLPTSPGDSIYLFEGFQAGIPPSWIVSGNWTVANGELIANAWTTSMTISVPGPSTRHDTATTTFIGRQDNPALISTIGLLHNFDRGASPERSELCYVTNTYVDPPFNMAAPGLCQRLYTGGQNWTLDQQFFDAYILNDRRDALGEPWGDRYYCGPDPGTSPTTLIKNGQWGPDHKWYPYYGFPAWNPTVTAANEVGLRVEHARARFKWLMITSRPTP